MEQAPTFKEAPKRRLGRIKFSVDCYENWPALQPVMRELVVIDVQHRFDTRTVEVLAYCHAFAEVPPAVMAPDYEAVVHKTHDYCLVDFRPVKIE